MPAGRLEGHTDADAASTNGSVPRPWINQSVLYHSGIIQIGTSRSPPAMTPPPARQPRKKILAVASSGGHWTQLLRLRPAFDGCEVVFVTTQSGSRAEVA